MLVVHASDALVTAACSVIVMQMARELIRRRADLGNDVSVIFHLVSAGFGLPTIQRLKACAATKAMAMQARARLN